MAKKTGLGKGLGSLFLESDESSMPENEQRTLRITEIQPRSTQPRKHFDSEALSELASSIAANGLIQPIVVRKADADIYEIVAGERRWRASKLAGLTEVPVVVLDLDDKATAEISLVENIQRKDLNPVEEAMAFKALLDDYKMTQEEVATRVGKSRSAIANTMRLLDLPQATLDMLSDGSISEGHARALLGLHDKSEIDSVAALVVERELSVRATEELVRRTNERPASEEPAEDLPKSVKEVDYVAELEKKIRHTIGRRVKITENRRGKKIEIEYTDNDDLEALLIKLCGEDILKD